MVAPWILEQKAESDGKQKLDELGAKTGPRWITERSEADLEHRRLKEIDPLPREETAKPDQSDSWAVAEMAKANLKDKRLNKRLVRILLHFGERPTASIPAACGGHTEMTAAYRFFDNPKVTWEKVLEPHQAATRQRMAHQPVVLLVQDTTELDVTRPQQQVVGAGPLDGPTRRGVYAHVMEAFTPDGIPLGNFWTKFFTREDEEQPKTKEEKRRERKALPIEEKESFRWLEGLRAAREVAQELPGTTIVCVADSEADIYDIFAEPRGERPVHWLIRACQDRAVLPEADVTGRNIRDRVAASPVLFTQEITIRARDPKTSCETRNRRVARKSRKAVVEVRAASMTLRPPERPGISLPEVPVNVVLVSEVDPPEREPSVEWILPTTKPIDTVEQVREIVQNYFVRWMIEVQFRTWKSGCRIEERQFETLDRLLPCLAVYLIVAWRVLMLSRLGRSCPDMDCEAILDPSEWQSVWTVIRHEPLPKEPPKLGVMLRLIAQLGGYVNRPNRPDAPGPQTLWLGMQRMRDLAWGWNTFGPGAEKAHDV
jgi:hypothetical protein